ncbi:MAG: glycosyltransferase family 4 protein [Bacteroidota bacterium]
MKIAIVLNTSWNIYNFRMGLIKTLISQGAEVHAVAPHDEYSSILEDHGCVYHKVRMDSRGANPVKDLALTLELFKIYQKIKPDIILHFTIKPNIYGTLAAHMLGIPTINNVCGLGTVFLKDNVVSKIAMVLYKWAFKYPNKVFFQNGDDELLFKRNKLIAEGLSEVIPGSGINLSTFKPLDNKVERKKKFTFLLISRLIIDKGVIEYVKAVEILRKRGYEAEFQILGATDTLHKRGIPAHIIDEWTTSGVINYLGTTKDVRKYISEADCVLLPSYREGTPRTLLEAASMKKPIIATDVPGCRNIVQHKYNGLLCKLKDVEDLADKMIEMYHMPLSLRDVLGQNGRKLVEEKFDEQIVIDKYINSLSELKPDIHQKELLAL